MYPDTSAVIAYYSSEVHSVVATRVLEDDRNRLAVSDFTVAEASAVLAARARAGSSPALLESQLRLIDMLVASLAEPPVTTPADVAAATGFVRRLDCKLRAPDALHLAICARVGATLLTLDANQAAAATVLGIPLAA